MRPDSGNSCAVAGILAGARVFSNRHVSGLPQSGYYDLDVEILFVPRPHPNAMPSEGDCVTQREGLPLPPATGLKGRIAEDGRWAVIEESSDPLRGRALWVRRVLPFLAALQGEVTLHASAVVNTAAVYAFVGASGTGKSTLSSSLAGFGLRTVADDLLPCRMRHGVVTIPLNQKQTFLPLRATYFLARQDSVEFVHRAQLNSADCLKRLLVNGFGEVSLKKAWVAQFILYGSIARTVPAYDLVVPNALSRLHESALEVKAMIVEQALQTTSLQADV
jgi:hypothetical protein